MIMILYIYTCPEVDVIWKIHIYFHFSKDSLELSTPACVLLAKPRAFKALELKAERIASCTEFAPQFDPFVLDVGFGWENDEHIYLSVVLLFIILLYMILPEIIQNIYLKLDFSTKGMLIS